MSKRYYWLKLKIDFFDDKNIKYIRKLADGDKILIVYLRMQLMSLKSEGVINYDSILPSCNEEIALQLDEDVNIVEKTIKILAKLNLIEIMHNKSLYLTAIKDVIGSETDAAARMRKMRDKKQEDIEDFNNEQPPFNA